MKVIIINGSARKNGHTSLMTAKLTKELVATEYHLVDYMIHPYNYDHGLDDDFISLMEHVVEYDAVLMATPVYWYSMSAQLKAFVDRFSELIRVRQDIGYQLRRMHLLALSCGSQKPPVDGFFRPFQLTADYLGMTYSGSVHTWALDGLLLDEVQRRLDEFVQRIKAIPNN